MPVHEKARAEMLVTDAREAIKQEAPLDRLRSLTTDLQQVYQSLGTSASGPSGGPGQPESAQGAQGAQGGNDDDVIDAEFTTNE